MVDFAAGAENDDYVINLYYERLYSMNQIRLHMANWATNSKHVKEVWSTEGVDFKEIRQILGMDWDTESDTSLWIPVMITANTLKALPLRSKSCKLRPDSTTPWAYYPLYR
jgi:hypothetical protein